MPKKRRKAQPKQPNTACIVCAAPLYRKPYAMREARFACCVEHRGEAFKRVERTPAQISAFEIMTAQAAVVRRLAKAAAAAIEAEKAKRVIVPPTIVVNISPSSVILCQVAEKHGITTSELRAPGRSNPEMFLARSEAARRLRDERGLTLCQIARMLGNRDHTSILRMVNEPYRQQSLAKVRKYAKEWRRKRASSVDSLNDTQDVVALTVNC